MRYLTIAVLSALWLSQPLVAADPRINFARDIQPLLANKCFACHGPDEAAREGELRLDTKVGAWAVRKDGRLLLVSGAPDRSELYRRVIRDDDGRMPPPDSAPPLSKDEQERIRRWIEQGAEWKQHWAFEAPRLVPLPRDRFGVARDALDLQVGARLSTSGLKPSPPADRTTIIRRVTLDLTGLPATPEEVDAFLADDAPDAYERVVDRLLASSRYGERLATDWLDAARYADTHGYLFDTERAMWRWRDWVIDAFNRNQPFDAFTVEQLAGDLLPKATVEQRIATGFNRNHLINNEAGAIASEYLAENIIDRVNTTATVWMGLSMACCQCHDHKYDPLSQREYYQFFAFFNNVPERGLDGLNRNAKPLMDAPTLRDKDELSSLRKAVERAEDRLASLAEAIADAQSVWESQFRKPTRAAVEGLVAHWSFDDVVVDCVGGDAETVFEAAPAAYADGVVGRAASFDGLAYVNAGDRFNFSAKDKFSLTAWVRPSTKEGRLTVFSRMKNAKDLFRGYTLQTFGGLPAFFLLHQFPDDMIQVQGKTVVEPERWSHLCVTYDGSGKAKGVRLYLNGQYQEPGVVVDKLKGPIVSDRDFWIGNGHPAAKLKGAVDEVRVYSRILAEEEIKELPGLSIQSLLAIDRRNRNGEQARRVRDYYLANHARKEWRDQFEALAEARAKYETRRRLTPTVMVMSELKKARGAAILERGAYNKPGEVVQADTPAILPPLGDRPKDRLGLARWLVAPNHPLTSRTTVNRYWQSLFGVGLVRTTEDFGAQGERPSHPALLDRLAIDFLRSGWDVKQLHRRIVTSRTYRQSSRLTNDQFRDDPENRLLARGPRKRLPAESIRDQALAVGGLLVEVQGGASVRSYQPPGLWREVAFDFSGANLTAQIYKQDQGAAVYRRSLYSFWKRTAPPPVMSLFDAPNRERCVVRRERTSTPLQALVLMNGPTFIEASRGLAERSMRAESTATDRIRFAFRQLLSRAPGPKELRPLEGLLMEQRQRLAGDSKQVDALLSVGDSDPDSSLDRVELAALTIVANVLVNLDETIHTN